MKAALRAAAAAFDVPAFTRVLGFSFDLRFTMSVPCLGRALRLIGVFTLCHDFSCFAVSLPSGFDVPALTRFFISEPSP